MNDKRLGIYLDDHLALMFGESQLAGRCRTSNEGTPLGEFLDRLVAELDAQQSVVRDVMQRIGGGEGIESMVKQSAAWVAEKLGRFKLNDALLNYSSLSRVLELEMLAAAAHERVALWDNLHSLSTRDPRIAGETFSLLLARSQLHFDELNAFRRVAAVAAFADR